MLINKKFDNSIIPFDFDIQRFSEPGEEGLSDAPTDGVDNADDGGSADDSSENIFDMIKQNLQDNGTELPEEDNNVDDNEPGGDPDNSNDDQPKEDELIDGKFKSVDDVVKSYKNSEARLTKALQELAELKKNPSQQDETTKALYEKIDALEKRLVNPEKNETESKEVSNEEILEKFYEDPNATIGEIVEKIVADRLKAVDEKVNPIVEKTTAIEKEKEMQKHAMKFAEQNPDYVNYKDTMSEAIKMLPKELQDKPQALDLSYLMAKGMKNPGNITPENILKDENMKKAILNDEGVKKEIIQGYLSEVNKQNKQAPNLISNNDSSSARIATPQNKPSTLDEASSIFKKTLGI